MASAAISSGSNETVTSIATSLSVIHCSWKKIYKLHKNACSYSYLTMSKFIEMYYFHIGVVYQPIN
jgi:hypothetical protein